MHSGVFFSCELFLPLQVYDFFKGRIEELYPLDPSPEDPLQVQREAHETFLDSRSQCVLGRDKLITQVSLGYHSQI